MPFLGQDWRSPGQSWVKTEEGWKKTTADDKNNNVSVQRLVFELLMRNVAAPNSFEIAQLLNAPSVCRERWRGWRGRHAEEVQNSSVNKGRVTDGQEAYTFMFSRLITELLLTSQQVSGLTNVYRVQTALTSDRKSL